MNRLLLRRAIINDLAVDENEVDPIIDNIERDFFSDNADSDEDLDEENIENVSGDTTESLTNKATNTASDQIVSNSPPPKVSLADWKINCEKEQIHLSEYFNNRIYDEFKENDCFYLFQKIAHALFGEPSPENITKSDLGLSKKEKETVDDIQTKLGHHSFTGKDVCMAVIFIQVYFNEGSQGTYPIFRVRSQESSLVVDIPQNKFIDHTGRVYNTWSKYKEENNFNETWICVPVNGFYSCNQQVEFLDQSSRGAVLKKIDYYSNIVNIGSTLGLLGGIAMTFFPPTAAIGATVVFGSAVGGAPGAAYGAGRSIHQLVDRGMHEQSVGFGNSEARACWITTAASLASALTVGSAQVLARSARLGEVASTSTQLICNSINVGSVCVSGVGIANSVYEVSQKDRIEASDVLHLTTSIFFFTHSVVSFKTAQSIIKEAQESHIANMKQSMASKRNQKTVDRLLKAAAAEQGDLHGNAQFIKSMEGITNKNKFFRQLYVRNDGKVSVNNKASMDVASFMGMNEADRSNILNLTKKLREKKITLQEFNTQTKITQEKANIRLDLRTSEAKKYIRQTLGVSNLGEIKVGSFDLNKLSSFDAHQIEHVVKKSLRGNKRLVGLVNEIADKQNITTAQEYKAVAKFTKNYIKTEVVKGNKNKTVENEENNFEKVLKGIVSNPKLIVNMMKEFKKFWDARTSRTDSDNIIAPGVSPHINVNNFVELATNIVRHEPVRRFCAQELLSLYLYESNRYHIRLIVAFDDGPVLELKILRILPKD